MHDNIIEHFLRVNSIDYQLYNSAKSRFIKLTKPVQQYFDHPPDNRHNVIIKHTETCAEIDDALKQNDYGRALSMFEREGMDSLSYCYKYSSYLLAQKGGDAPKAKSYFEQLFQDEPHLFRTAYVDYLISAGDHILAFQLVESSLHSFDVGFKLPTDSFMFEELIRTTVQAIKASYYVDKAKMHHYIERILERLDDYEYGFSLLASVLCEIQSFSVVVDIYVSRCNIIKVNNVQSLKPVALAYYHMNNFTCAQSICYSILLLDKYNCFAITTLLVIDRKSKKFEMPIGRYEELALDLPGSRFSRDLLREIAVHHYENNDRNKALLSLQSSGLASDDKQISFVGDHKGITHFENINMGNLVVVKSGPSLAFEYLYSHLLHAIGRPFDTIGGDCDFDTADTPLISNSIHFPSSLYVHERDYDSICAQKNGSQYDNCIVIMSSLCFNCYSEIFKLAQSLANNVYIYSMLHVASAKYCKTLLGSEYNVPGLG